MYEKKYNQFFYQSSKELEENGKFKIYSKLSDISINSSTNSSDKKVKKTNS